MTKRLLLFLQSIELALPPAPSAHHSLTACKYGSDDSGWRHELGLHLRLKSKDGAEHTQTFFLNDHDLERPIAETIAALIAIVDLNR